MAGPRDLTMFRVFRAAKSDESVDKPPQTEDLAALRFERAARLYAHAAIVLGLSGVAGWWWHIPVLSSVVPGLAPMKLGTALALIVAGACILLVGGEAVGRVRRIIAALLTLGLVAWGAIIIWCRMAGSLLPEPGPIQALFLTDLGTGSASSVTGVQFLLLSGGVLDLCRRPFGTRHAQPIALTGLMIGVIAITGYAYDVHVLYSPQAYNSMGLNTAAAFVLLFAAMLLCRPRDAWITIFAGDGPSNLMARRVLPVAILLPFICGWLLIVAIDSGGVPLSLGVAASTVFSAVLISGIVWRTAHNVARADAARRGTARALRRSDHLKSAVLEAVLDPIITLDRDGWIIEANMAARHALGIQPRGGRIDAYFAPGAPPPLTFPRQWDEDLALNQRTETVWRRADGATFPAETTISQTWPDGRQTLVLHIRDLTQQKATETQLRQAQKMEAVGQLTGGLAHDFNNLLAIILGNLDLLWERLDQPALKDDLVRPAIVAAERGAQLTQRLLAFGRRQSLQPAITDVNVLIEGLTDMLRRTLGHAIEIRCRLIERPWPTRIDPGQLENAVLNLAINARDAMEAGGRLTIETYNVILDEDYALLHPEIEPGPFIRLTIADTGAGMPPEVAARAFEPFFTTKDVGKGTGLGLSMVYGFIKQSGGHIRLYSEPGYGTVVALYLPRSEARDAVRDEPAIPALPTGSGETVLVVEDDPDLLAVTVGMLEDLSYRTLTAGTGAAALDALEAGSDVDLMLTDLVLPGGMNGADLAQAVRARWPAIPIVYTSGYADNVLGGRAEDDDIPVLQKPFRRADLAYRLRQVLQAGAASGGDRP